MKPENKAFLEANYHHWVTLRDAQYLKGLNAGEREGMQRVMSEEFIPGYTCDLWCPACCADMVKLLFTKYEAWKAAHPESIQSEPLPEPLPTVENVVANFPKHEKPNKRKRR